MTVITRFAPSPTGFLHIGGARTALFNWLFARHHGGKFLLRIEDTDRERSTQEAIDAIIDGMRWMGLDHDGEIIYQSVRIERHREIAQQMLEQGLAYRCYCTPEELESMRAEARAKGHVIRSPWRDKEASEAPADIAPTIRLKAPDRGEFELEDAVQGIVTIRADQLDDMVLLRSDGTPTYMLAVVVDDHDMGITHIIRGDDHLNNAFRQCLIYDALGWNFPTFSHIPLIHGSDGAKLSKRHGALGVHAYRDMGYLPEAMRNYLLRLGWSHGDDEIITTEQAISWFDLNGIGKSPARFDTAKLDHLNAHYLRTMDHSRLASLVRPGIEKKLKKALTEQQNILLLHAFEGLKQRANHVTDIVDGALFYFQKSPLELDERSATILRESDPTFLEALRSALDAIPLSSFHHDALHQACKDFGEAHEMKLGAVMQPIRAALTGRTASPSMFEVMELLGKTETLLRLRHGIQYVRSHQQEAAS